MSQPRFLQGLYDFSGQGLEKPFLLDPDLRYTVPAGHRTQAVYFRAGNATDTLVYCVLMRDGHPMRYFPIGAQSDNHVPLRVVEDLLSDTVLEVYLAAPLDVAGSVVLDIGLVEI